MGVIGYWRWVRDNYRFAANASQWPLPIIVGKIVVGRVHMEDIAWNGTLVS